MHLVFSQNYNLACYILSKGKNYVYERTCFFLSFNCFPISLLLPVPVVFALGIQVVEETL